MHSALSWLQVIHVAGIEREVGTAILQQHTGITTDHTTTKAIIQALDQRDNVSLTIGHTQIHSVTFALWTRTDLCCRLLKRNACALLCSIGFAKKAFYR